MTVLKSPIDPELAEKAIEELTNAPGENKVTTNKSILFSYSGSALPIPKTMPDVVVRPDSVEDVQVVLKIADRLVIPVTPVASGTLEPSVFPRAGGIVLDTYAMGRILEINADAAYAVIEPGVSIGELVRAIRPHGFRITLGSYPPGNSVLGNYHLKGHGTHRSSGIDSECLGLEVVLPDGTVVRTGSKAFEDSYPGMGWHLQWGPLPDLRGIFLNACGTLGVITKMAVRLYPLNDVQAMPIVGFDSYADSVEFMKIVSRANLVEHTVTWHWGLYTVIDILTSGGKVEDSSDYLKLFVPEPWTDPGDRPYNLVLNIMTGYQEDIDAHAVLIKKIAEGLYHCTLCKTCAQQCATDQDPTAIAREVRNEFVRRTGAPPGDGKVIVKSTINYRNPYQQPKAMRYRWAKGLDIKDASKEQVDTLYYVGCTAAMIPERTHFALNTVKLLDASGESFGTLGRKEVCCGSTSFNLGGQDAFREVASENIDMINGLGVERVVTSCAGCYSIMKNEYPKLKRLNFEVFHFVEYLDELIRDGKLKLTKKLDLELTYHDPCHLGRYCELYDAPRRIIEALPGVKLVEMPRNRENSWCCGAGAGVKTIYPDFALWTSEERVKEARETGAEAMVTACPFCEGNLADGIAAGGSGMDLYDITDLVLMALE